jgi:D-alanyl-lipoteichoic acid acyltransferase DltB (MBOAT superfamily)
MLFNSIDFIFIFFPAVVIGFYFFGSFKTNVSIIFLCISSLYFFCQWNAHYLGLLLISIVMNYGFGYVISRSKKGISRIFLIGALIVNLLLLCYYKYAGFFIENINYALGTTWSFGNIILPLGISFFTFTQIAFLVDAHRGKAKEYNFF